MGGLRGRLRNLEREAETMTLVCPECGEEFRVHEDTSVAYLVWDWSKETGEKGYWTEPPDLLYLQAHAHDAGAFLDKSTGAPFMDALEPKTGQIPRYGEDDCGD